MMKMPILMTLLGALALTSTAVAEPGRGKHFEKFDTNADGKISPEEFSKHQTERFQAADANKDGKLTQAELKTTHDARTRDRFANRLARLDKNGDGNISRDEAKRMPDGRFESLDTNKDGVVSQDEFEAAHGKSHVHGKDKGKEGHPRAARMWEHLDQNSDGAVTLAEMKSSTTFFARFDGNKDGFVTREEMAKRKGPQGKRHDKKRAE